MPAKQRLHMHACIAFSQAKPSGADLCAYYQHATILQDAMSPATTCAHLPNYMQVIHASFLHFHTYHACLGMGNACMQLHACCARAVPHHPCSTALTESAPPSSWYRRLLLTPMCSAQQAALPSTLGGSFALMYVGSSCCLQGGVPHIYSSSSSRTVLSCYSR